MAETYEARSPAATELLNGLEADREAMERMHTGMDSQDAAARAEVGYAVDYVESRHQGAPLGAAALDERVLTRLKHVAGGDRTAEMQFVALVHIGRLLSQPIEISGSK